MAVTDDTSKIEDMQKKTVKKLKEILRVNGLKVGSNRHGHIVRVLSARATGETTAGTTAEGSTGNQ